MENRPHNNLGSGESVYMSDGKIHWFLYFDGTKEIPVYNEEGTYLGVRYERPGMPPEFFPAPDLNSING